jgi:cytochrome c5
MVAAQNRRSMLTATYRAATIGSGTIATALLLAAQPAQLAETVCGSCHTLEVVTKLQATPRAAAKHDRAKELVESVCTLCHEFARVKRQQLSKDEWAGVIKGMLAEGAPLTDEEFSMVVDYLARTYGVKETE